MTDTIEAAAKEMTSSQIVGIERVRKNAIRLFLIDGSYLLVEVDDYNRDLEVYHIVPIVAKVEVSND